VAAGKLKIVRSKDGSVHPIEAEYLAPEVHSLMKVHRPVVRAADLDRVVLLVSKPMSQLKSTSPWVNRYLRYGQAATFESKKSEPVPIPQRSTCAARDPWYDLTGISRPGIAFWPMAQQYRHIIASNPDRLICNHNLFDVAARNNLSQRESDALAQVRVFAGASNSWNSWVLSYRAIKKQGLSSEATHSRILRAGRSFCGNGSTRTTPKDNRYRPGRTGARLPPTLQRLTARKTRKLRFSDRISICPELSRAPSSRGHVGQVNGSGPGTHRSNCQPPRARRQERAGQRSPPWSRPSPPWT
jgi:hypothetical protein